MILVLRWAHAYPTDHPVCRRPARQGSGPGVHGHAGVGLVNSTIGLGPGTLHVGGTPVYGDRLVVWG